MWKYESFSCLPLWARLGMTRSFFHFVRQYILLVIQFFLLLYVSIWFVGFGWCLIERSEWGFCFQVYRPVINKEGYCPLRFLENLGFVLRCDKFMLFLESWCIELDSILFRITGKREKHGMQYHIRGMPLLS